MSPRAKEGEDYIACPLCGMNRLRPRPFIAGTTWTDNCACSDRGRCVGHQVCPEDAPDRPSEEVMLERAKARAARDMERWERLRKAFGDYVASKIPHDHED